MSTEASLNIPEETLDTEWVERNELMPNSWNPNGMVSEKQEELIQSILTHGWTAPLVVDEDGRIIDGEQRWHASNDLRIRDNEDLTPDDMEAGRVPIHRIDPDEDQAKIATLQFNLQGEHNDEDVGSIFADLEEDGLRSEVEDMLHMRPVDVDEMIEASENGEADGDTTADSSGDDEENEDDEAADDDEYATSRYDHDTELMQRFTVKVSSAEARILSTVLDGDISSDRLLMVLDNE